MTSTLKTKSNQMNALRSTGPKTQRGKKVVSKNAISHGATSKQFINDAENQAYQELIDALKQSYASDDPLISMQLDRMAKIKVQLDRVQSLINQSFDEASLSTSIDQHLMNILNLDDPQRAKAVDSDEKIDAIDVKRLEAAQELLRNKALTFNTHAEFLSKTPLFCEYLYERARFFETTLDLYIQKEESFPGTRTDLETRLTISLGKLVSKDNRFREMDTMQNAITKISLDRLLKVATKLIDYPHEVEKADVKITMFNILKNSNIFTEKPNYEDLNNLYRYQTTLQRQYSTALGELLVLNRRSSQL